MSLVRSISGAHLGPSCDQWSIYPLQALLSLQTPLDVMMVFTPVWMEIDHWIEVVIIIIRYVLKPLNLKHISRSYDGQPTSLHGGVISKYFDLPHHMTGGGFWMGPTDQSSWYSMLDFCTWLGPLLIYVCTCIIYNHRIAPGILNLKCEIFYPKRVPNQNWFKSCGHTLIRNHVHFGYFWTHFFS